ncbi:RsmE family RNA methyltransferase [Chitinophagaceae bacterium LWZ2-11]
MSLPYFYEPDISALQSHIIILSEETSKHCVQVLRMKPHERLQLTDGNGNLYTASIIKDDKRKCEVLIENKLSVPPIHRKICIGISLLKNANRFEWFLEKATELGIQEIIPLICKRTERQHFRFDRMHNIIVAAMLQSQQAWLPKLHEPVQVEKVIAGSEYGQKLIAHCEDTPKLSFKDFVVTDNVQMLIGPEGDFSHEEIEASLKNNYLQISLGDTRLRTETAGIVAATLLRTY